MRRKLARCSPGTLSQAFSLSATSFVSFDAAFLAFDYAPYDDDAYVRVISLSSSETVFASSVGAVGCGR